MKAYKIELLVIDFESSGIEEIKRECENLRYVHGAVKSTEERDIGPWYDEHPLNLRATADAEYLRLFPHNNQGQTTEPAASPKPDPS